MKKEYSKPDLDTKAFAQFENVFTRCTKGNSMEQGCVYVDEEKPKGPLYAAYGTNGSV